MKTRPGGISKMTRVVGGAPDFRAPVVRTIVGAMSPTLCCGAGSGIA